MSSSEFTSASNGHYHNLTGLTTREQIADVLIRACLALDCNNRALWESAWLASDPAISMTVPGRPSLIGMATLNKDCLDLVGPKVTQHLISGVRIEVQEGATTARLTCNAQNQHFRKGQGLVQGAEQLLAGSTYDVELVKDDSGEWRMRTWTLHLLWTQGEWAVMQPEEK